MKKLLLIFLIFISLVNAQNINVVKDAPDSININEVLKVDISVNNPSNSEKSYDITETIPQGFTLINPKEPDNIEQRNGISVMLYHWKITIQPNKIFTLSYKIKPNQVGEYTIPPTKVDDVSTNTIYLSQPKQLIVMCAPDNKCQDNENYINCPQDCGRSIKDGICDYISDGKCDPDCDKEPDCNNAKINYNYYIFGVILLVILILIIKFFKKPREI